MDIITNQGALSASRPRLAVECQRIYAPSQDWTYSHHPSLAFFRDRFMAIWSNGRVNEDDVGQRVLISTSPDFATWSEPKPLIDTRMGEEIALTFTAAGLHQHAGVLVAYAGRWEYDPAILVNGARQPAPKGHRRTSLCALTSSDGQTWSELRDLKLPIVSNHGPQATASGRLIISGNVSYPYSDDPSGLGRWTLSGIYPQRLAGQVVDEPGGFQPVAQAAGWRSALCEGSWFQTDDGVLHLLLRSHEKLLWQSESRDDGASWSEPVPSQFTDNNTKFHFGRLPDGRFYQVGCPDRTGDRNPLVLSLSRNGIAFDQAFIIADEVYAMQREGMHKNGQYGYPHSLIHDDHLYVIASRRKEAVDVFRIPLRQLG